MPRLSRSGVTVNVDDDTAERLTGSGWVPVEAEKPKRATRSRKQSDNDE